MHIIIRRLTAPMNHLNGVCRILMPSASEYISKLHLMYMFNEGLRFLLEELGWHQSKVDDLLLPIIQKIGKRGQVCF